MGMTGISFSELILIFTIVLIVFGSGKLKYIGKDIGEAINGFKSSLSEQADKDKKPSTRAGKLDK